MTLSSQLTDRDLLHLYSTWLLQALDAGDTARVDALAAKRADWLIRVHDTERSAA